MGMSLPARISAWIFIIAGAMAVPRLAAEGKDLIVHQQGDVSYVSGGVGEEKQALETAGRQFNLKVTLALTTGHFSSDARVSIEDGTGRSVLDTVVDGPILYARLPPGAYSVRCTLNGKEIRQTAEIGNGRQRDVSCTWSAD